MEKKNGMSRRDFIKGTAAGAAGIAAAGFLGSCSNDAQSSDSSESQSSGELMTYEHYQDVKWAFEVAPDPIMDISAEEHAEIIVIGSGMSGLTTAYSAAENGAEVVLISGSSGPISRGGSNQSYNSKVMEKYGVEPLDVAKLFKREYMAASYHVDQLKWSKFVNHSEEAMNWLIDKVEAKGIKVLLERDNSDEIGQNFAHGFVAPDSTGSMVASGQQSVVEALDGYCRESGVSIHYSTIARQLVREENNNGRVTAVIAEKDGKYIQYNGSKAIVLATGDFSRDRDMMSKYCSWVLPLIPEEDSGEEDYNVGFSLNGLFKGDGQKMGLWVGAAWQKSYPNAPMLQGQWGGGHEPLGFHSGLVVNLKGKRFHNEDCSAPYSAVHLLTQPEYKSFGIWGENFAQDLVDSGHEWHTFGQIYTDPAWTPHQMIQMWDEGIEDGSYFKAETLEELCELMDLPVSETLSSISRYNDLCSEEKDIDFFKDPSLMININDAPFYGSIGKPTFMTVMGGLRTDEHMQVCDETDKPIPGLFNVGQMIGDMYANTYNFAIPGHSLGGNCLTFGYLLGRGLALNTIEANL